MNALGKNAILFLTATLAVFTATIKSAHAGDYGYEGGHQSENERGYA